uniref:Uncharacterized protein n=1 Tax=Rhipicephalus appendiculatus TaxID=34631 RepID=A0A131YEQ1_RHIAP
MNTDPANYRLSRTKYEPWLATLHFTDICSLRDRRCMSCCGICCNEEILRLSGAQNSKASIKIKINTERQFTTFLKCSCENKNFVQNGVKM